MHRLLRVSFALIALATAAAAPAEARGPSAGGPSAEPDRSAWPHEAARLKPDPGVRYGVLPNGMRFAIMRNTQPAGTAAVRLRFAAGSVYESEDDRGLAHFLEHMNFNGSENLPEGEFVKLLQRSGLAFGADTNAYTSFLETVYQLDLPKTDEKTVDTALFVLRETADRLTFDPEAIDRERGVVLSEERTRDSPEYRSFRKRFSFLLRDQIVADRLPIGTPETIRSVDREDFKDFYGSLYAPERAFFVIVGDVEPDAIEQKLRASFSDWTREGPQAATPRLGRPAPRRLEASHHVEPGLASSVSLSWVSPPDLDPDSERARREEIVRALALSVVQRRLDRIARAADAPFIGASISRGVTERSITVASLSVSVRPGAWRQGMAAAEQELRRALRHGLDQVELDREITEMRVSYEAGAAGAATRDSRALANAIAAAYDGDYAFTHPADDMVLFDRAVRGLTAAQATAQLRRDFRGDGPLIFVSGAEPIEGGDQAILAAYRDSAAAKVEAPPKTEKVAFDYDFGRPGVVAERTRNEEFDLTLVRFENGVRLTHKQTPFEDDRVRVGVRFPGGLASWPSDKPGLVTLAPFVMGEGGLGQLSQEDLERALADKIFAMSFDISEDAVSWRGATRPEDLDVQMRVLAALTKDPGFRPEGLLRIQAAAENFIRQYETTPGRVLSRDAGAILRAGDPRWRFPNLEQVQALAIDDFKAAIQPILETTPIEISIVGDIDADAAIAAAAKTFGAFAPRPQAAGAVAPIAFAPGRKEPLTLAHKGRPDQAVAFIAWPSVDFSDTRKARATRLARQILENRLVEDYREAQGATYSPSTGENFSDVFKGFGYVSASVEAPPEAAEGFYKTVAAIVDELRNGRFGDDDIARARGPALEQLRTAERGNGYWAAVLADAQTNVRRFEIMRTRISELEAVTKAEIVAAARATFVEGEALRIVVLPEGAGQADPTR